MHVPRQISDGRHIEAVEVCTRNTRCAEDTIQQLLLRLQDLLNGDDRDAFVEGGIARYRKVAGVLFTRIDVQTRSTGLELRWYQQRSRLLRWCAIQQAAEEREHARNYPEQPRKTQQRNAAENAGLGVGMDADGKNQPAQAWRDAEMRSEFSTNFAKRF